MTLKYDAIYERGVFRIVAPPPDVLVEGQSVSLLIEMQETQDALELLTKVYADLSESERDDLERITLNRSRTFLEQYF